MKIVSCGITDVGLKRGHNEDNYLINEELNLYVVADGMGGHAGGEYASAIAVNTVEEVVTNLESRPSQGSDEDPASLAQQQIGQAIRLAGRRIFEKAKDQPEYHGMGTTVVVLYVRDGNAYVAHVGDSRVYLQRDGRILQITERWEAALGPDLARHCRPDRLRDDVLDVEVVSSVWCQQLQLQSPQLLAALEAELGELAPKALRFRIG